MMEKNAVLENIKAVIGALVIAIEEGGITSAMKSLIAQPVSELAQHIEAEYNEKLTVNDCLRATRESYLRFCMDNPLLTSEQKIQINNLAWRVNEALDMGEKGVTDRAALRRELREAMKKDIDEDVWNRSGFMDHLFDDEYTS